MKLRPDVQAADWLARVQRDDLSDAERAELEGWLEADAANAVAFARAEFAWERAERLRALPEQALASAAVTEGRDSLSSQRRGLRPWQIAAMMTAVLVGAVAWFVTTAWNVFTTGVGEHRTVALNDGSQVSLNTASRIEVVFDAHSRTVRLVRGEALFKVAHDTRRPFIVQVGDSEVRAVGTAFNVRLRSHVVEVTVTEGKVRVGPSGSQAGTSVDGLQHATQSTLVEEGAQATRQATVLLSAGSAAVVAAGAVQQVALADDAVRRRIAWRAGVIELKGETLSQAVEEFNRYRNAKLVVADPAIADLRVGGRFETAEAAKFVNALTANFSIRAVNDVNGDTYLMGAE